MILRLALSSLRNRLLATVLTALSIALSVSLLLGVEQVRTGVRASFSNTISGTDLIVGTRVGQLQLILFTVFGIGSTPDNIDYATFERYRDHPAVAWVVPFSLGDSHRGFRVIGTTEDYFQHYRYRRDQTIEFAKGTPPRDVFDATIGYQVAKELGYDVGREIVVTHGLSGTPGILDHDESPFTVVGVLERTNTPVDQAVFVTLAGMEAMHDGEFSGSADGFEPESLTAFFVGVRSRIDTLRLQREISTDENEPLMAIVPGVALAELWRGINVADAGLKAVAALVVLVGLLGMMVSLLSTLDERRRETAILRAVGASRRMVVLLLLFEALALTAGGIVVGIFLNYALLITAQPLLESALGLAPELRAPAVIEWIYLGLVLVAGGLAGLVPALQAYRKALADGLTMRL